MTDQAISILSGTLRSIWALFNSWNIPGTNITPAELGFFMMFASVGVAIIGYIFNHPMSVSISSSRPYERDKRFDMPGVDRPKLGSGKK